MAPVTAHAGEHMSRRWLALALEAFVPVAVVALWWELSRDSTNPYFPPLAQIVAAFRENWLFARVSSDVLPSLARLAAGFVIALFAGISSGVLLGLNTTARRMMDPIVEFMRAIPAPAMIPFGIIVLGVGDSMKIAIITLVCLWPILLTTVDGVRGVESLILDSAVVYHLRPWERLWRVIIPAACPQIFAGLRTAVSLGLIVMVISEMVASTNGIGYFILQSQRSFDLPDMWSGVVLLGILGYGLNLLVLLAERFVLRWHRGARRLASN